MRIYKTKGIPIPKGLIDAVASRTRQGTCGSPRYQAAGVKKAILVWVTAIAFTVISGCQRGPDPTQVGVFADTDRGCSS